MAGRPRKTDDEAMVVVIRLRLTRAQASRVRRRAAQAGMTVSAWLRWRGEAGAA